MKKTIFLFFMLFASTYCFSQSTKNIDHRFKGIANQSIEFERFIPTLEAYRANPSNFTASFTPNMDIIDAIIDESIWKYENMEESLRLYFSTQEDPVREDKETEILTFIDNL